MLIKGLYGFEQLLRQDGEGNRCRLSPLRLTHGCCQPRVLHLSWWEPQGLLDPSDGGEPTFWRELSLKKLSFSYISKGP